MTDFEKYDSAFRNQDMNVFNGDEKGLLWLKVRAISRSKQLHKFAKANKFKLGTVKISEQNVELFNILKEQKFGMCLLDNFLNDMNNEWYEQLGVDIEQLKIDLYKVREYLWGGDQNNSLDKYFISRYVKVISSYEDLESKQVEIGVNAWNYVRNSWYNNWTSFVIESLFKCNEKIISAVGEIKSVDFFISNFPIDLKVTFFPNEFMEQKLKEIFGKSYVSWLKMKCKEVGVSCDPKTSVNQQCYTLIQKLKELNHNEIIDELSHYRRKIVSNAQKNPIELMKWLYENQGPMRFGAENRIFLILYDVTDPDLSWQMKRAFSLIEPAVKKYIEDFSPSSLKTIEFEFNKKHYTSLSDVLFVVR